MDSSNWRPAQPEPAMEGVAGGGDWRSQLPPDSRQRIVNKIMETLKRHLPCSGQDGLQELKKIAIRFEEKIYSAATSQSDYLRKISLKMLTMESKSQNPMSNTLPANSSGVSRNPQDSAPQSMQSQLQNQGQSLGMPMAPIQSQVQGRQQLLAHNVQNNISSAGMQNSSSLSSTLPPVSGLTQNPMPNVAQNSNIHNIGQGSASSAYTNVQRQMQGRQHVPQGGAQQQQSQNQQQYMYQQQIQQQMMKQNLHPGNMQQSLLQPHIQQPQQQQNLLPSAQLQSSQQSVMPTSTVMQPPMVSGLPPNQQASVQQQSQSVYQQHQQSLSRQQQQPQQASVHQQPNQMSQQSMLQMQQQQPSPQQQMMGQQANVANVQPSQLMGQQNSLPDMQQQRLLGQLANLPSQQHNNHQNLQPQQLVGQQNNLSNMHQQQLGHQSQQLPGAQSGNPGMPTSQHPSAIMQQSKVAGNQQTQSSSGLVPGGGQQPQQQLMTQIQSQPTQLQQPLGLQQQQSNLQHNMQQRLQTSNSLLQQQNMIDQQKQMFQSQRGLSEAPSTSLDSTAQTSGAVDCQEEVYQKIKTMKDMYFADLNEFHQKVSMKLQQVDSHPQQPKMENIEKLRIFKQSLERMMHFLQLTKNNNLSTHKDRLPLIEKQIMSFLSSNRPRRPVSSLQQGQLPPPHQSMQHMQQPHTQTSQAQSHETGLNSQVQSLSSQGPGALQQGNVSSLQQGSVSVITSSQQNMNSSLQPPGSLDSGQGNAAASKQQAAMGSLQQNPVGASLQASINSLPAQSGNLLHSNVSSLQSNSNVLQNQHKQHEQHVMQTQQLKQQLQQRQIQQQFQKHQLRQQQQQHPQLQQLKQQQLQQTGQMQSHPNTQLHQMNDVNDIKLKSGISLKQGVFQQHLSQGQRYSHQQLKNGASFPISAPQVLSSVSPQINQHSSPHIDQQNLLPSMTKVGTPSQSANSPFIAPSPSTPLAPSPMVGDSEKVNTSGAPLSSAANVTHQQPSAIPTSASTLAIGTPGISASPLLAEFTVPDGNNVGASAVPSGKSGITEQPIERLLKAMKSISSKALGAAVSDIGSVVNVMDRIAGSAPGNGSRAAVGEDLVAMTKCRLQARSFITQDGSNGTKKMRRYTSAMPLNFVSSAGSMNDNCMQLTGSETAELESTATSNVKRPKANPSLLEEIREINERLIDTVVDISDEDVDPTVTAATVKGGEGTIVKCSYIAVALSPDFKALYASGQMSQIQPLRLLIPANYPNCSPILLDKFPVEVSKEVEDLSAKAKSRFSISLRALSQPMSIKDVARTWDACTRAVMCELAEQRGGGTFSSKYGGWEDVSSWDDVLTAA